MTQLTIDEKRDIITKSLDAAERGDHNEALRLAQLMPLPLYLAKVVKDIWGAEFLRNSGWDLSEAEAEYGKNWLDV